MLKKEGKLYTFEQIQACLGKVRNEPDIIVQINALLDEINEEIHMTGTMTNPMSVDLRL